MKNLKVLSALFILSMILTGCKKDNVVTKQPFVVTNPPTDITVSSFAYGGDVVEDGHSPVTARGICYATHKLPSLNDKYTSDGSGTGRFSGVIKGLAEGTTYYFRAYATNQVGTSYGELKQLTTKERKKIKGAEQAYSGLESKPTKVKLKGVDINCVEVNGKVFYQGDILIKDSSLRGMGLDYESYRWPENTVYYDIDPSFPRKERIEDAIQLFEPTNIKFKKRGNEDNYVYFRYIPGAGCYSYLGMIGGKQDVVIDNWGEAGEIAHEIAHALGILHEQCKPNRDQYIRVIFENIEAGKEHNFEIFGGLNQYDEPFDFGSIMLYHSWSFSKDGELPTITKKDGTTFIPQRERLSDADVAILNRLYPKVIYPVSGVTVTPLAKSMTVGDQFQLSVTIAPANATNKAVTYMSSDQDIVSVDTFGKVVALKPGEAVVSVTTEDGGKTATCDIKVNPKIVAVESITLSPETKSIIVGESFVLTVSVLPTDATNKNVTYESSDVGIVSIDQLGKIKAIRVGKATITVTTEDGGKTATCEVTVKPVSNDGGGDLPDIGGDIFGKR